MNATNGSAYRGFMTSRGQVALMRAPTGSSDVRQKVAEPATKPGSVVDNHSSRPCVTARLKQHTRGRVEPTHSPPIWPCSRWGLPCHAALAPHAVSSYLAVSPLPRTSCDAVRRFVFCCTFRRLAPPRRYLAPCSVEPGLSSARSSRDAVVLADSAGSDCLTFAGTPRSSAGITAIQRLARGAAQLGGELRGLRG